MQITKPQLLTSQIYNRAGTYTIEGLLPSTSLNNTQGGSNFFFPQVILVMSKGFQKDMSSI